MLFTTSDCLKTPVDLVKLWLHEASRVYGDKLIEQKDMETFQKLKFEVSKAAFEVYMLPKFQLLCSKIIILSRILTRKH